MCKSKMKLQLIVMVLLVFFGSVAALAQTITGDIGGTVVDASGAVIPGATITAVNAATNVKTTAVTNKQGIYSMRFLQIGQYTVIISYKGFNAQKIGPFALEISQVAKIDGKLVPGSEASVQVSSQLEPILNTENGTISATVTGDMIETLPVNGRSSLSLTEFVPGTSIGDQNQFNGATGSPNNSGERTQSFATLPNVNGNRTSGNNYYVDGIENTDSGSNLNNGFGAPIYNPSPDSLAELQVISTNPPAEFGNANGGQVVMVLKSGTNKYHGSAFATLQNWQMDANTFGDKRIVPGSGGTFTPRTKYTQTQFGATFGGPVRIPHLFNGQDKLFFFADYQGYRKPSGGTSTTSVALNAWRGNTTSSNSADTSVSPLANYAYFGSAVPQLYDSQNNFAPFNQTIGGVTYKNLVPINSQIAKYLFANPALYPVANTVGSGLVQNNYSGNFKSLQRNDQADLKVDYKVSEKDAFFIRGSYSEANDQQTKVLIPVGFPGKNEFPYKSVVVNEVHTFSSRIVNEFRAGYMRASYNQLNPTAGAVGTNGDALVGIPLPGAQTVVGFTQQSFNGAGAQGVGSFGTPGAGNTAVDNNFEYGDNLTVTFGRHIVKAGGQLIRYQNNFFQNVGNGLLGVYGYSGAFTGDPAAGTTIGYDFADFLLGYVASRNIGLATGDVGLRQYRGAVFAQDSYKATPALTLTFGVRWQYTQPVYEAKNRISNFSLTSASLQVAGVNGNSRAMYNAYYGEFNPRVGFAWQAKPRLVFRGGFGITTFMDYNALHHTGNSPFFATVSQTAQAPTTTSSGSPYLASQGFPAAVGTNSSYTAWSPNLRPNFIPQFDLVAEYQINRTSSISVAYVGETGTHLLDTRNPNQWLKTSTPTSAPFFSSVGPGSINYIESEAIMNFNSGQVSYRQRPARGLEFTLNYTIAKNLSDSVGPFGVNDISNYSTFPEDSYHLAGDYGPPGQDIHNFFNAIVVYALPFGRGKEFGANMNRFLDLAVGGWKVSTDAVMYSGFPITIRAGTTGTLTSGSSAIVRARKYRPLKKVGSKFGYIASASTCSATTGIYNCGPNNEAIAGYWGSDPSATHSNYIGAGTCNNASNAQDDGSCAYGIPTFLTLPVGSTPNFSDTVSVGSERSPGFRGFDASLVKEFHIYGDHMLVFNANAYNAGNITSYNNPNGIINGSNNWGIVQSTRSQQRQLELALRYKF